jgi:signal transduction histidine kinase
LTKLLGHAELLADSEEILPEQTKRSIQTMFQATQDLVSLLESLTQLIDLDSHTRLHRRYGDVADLLREIASDFTAPSKNRAAGTSVGSPAREVVRKPCSNNSSNAGLNMVMHPLASLVASGIWVCWMIVRS